MIIAGYVTRMEDSRYTQWVSENNWGKEPTFKNPGIGGRIILKYIFQK
jgi:hypothetical protein